MIVTRLHFSIPHTAATQPSRNLESVEEIYGTCTKVQFTIKDLQGY